jgi:CRP-like cAMP-binding protein
MVFHRVERLDVLKMARLLVPPDFGKMALTPGAQVLANIVGERFREQAVLPEVAEALHRLDLLRGLSSEQTRRVAASCHVARFAKGETLFEAGAEARKVHVVLEGTVEVRREADGPAVGEVGPGESLGEIALLTGQPHSAQAVALRPVRTATLDRRGFEALARQRPDIATILLRNLAVGLGTKLQRLGATVSSD